MKTSEEEEKSVMEEDHLMMDGNIRASFYLYVSMSVHWPQGVTPAFLLMRERGRQRWMLPRSGGEPEEVQWKIKPRKHER